MGRRAARAAGLLACVLLGASAAGCGTSAADGRAAAAAARQQVTPAARDLYQRLIAAHASGVSVGLGDYVRCGTSGTRLHYSVVLNLFPTHRGEILATYRQQVTAAVSGAGWKLRQAPPPLPADPGTAFYKITKPVGSVVLVGALGVLPSAPTGARGTAVINSACFDAGPAADSLLQQVSRSPLA